MFLQPYSEACLFLKEITVGKDVASRFTLFHCNKTCDSLTFSILKTVLCTMYFVHTSRKLFP